MHPFCKIMATAAFMGFPAFSAVSSDVMVSTPTGIKELEGLKFEKFHTQMHGMTFVFARNNGSWKIVVTLLNDDKANNKDPSLANVHAMFSSHPESVHAMKRVSELGSMKGSDGETWHYFTAISPGEPTAVESEWEPDPTPVRWVEGKRAGYRIQLYVADKGEDASPEKLGKIAESLIQATIKAVGPKKRPVAAHQNR